MFKLNNGLSIVCRLVTALSPEMVKRAIGRKGAFTGKDKKSGLKMVAVV